MNERSELLNFGKSICIEIESLSKKSAYFDKNTGLMLFVYGSWVRGSGVTKNDFYVPRSETEAKPVYFRRKSRKPGEKRRAPTGKNGGALMHQQIMHEMRCIRWGVKCKCAEHTPFPNGFVLKALPGGPAQKNANQLRRILNERNLIYLTGEVFVVVSPYKKTGTAVDGVAIDANDRSSLWVIELKTGHRNVSLLSLKKHKAQTRAGMIGLRRVVEGQKNKRVVVGGLLIYLSEDQDCVRVELVHWE